MGVIREGDVSWVEPGDARLAYRATPNVADCMLGVGSAG